MKKRILALDIGDVSIGVAHTDLSQTIVFSYQTWKKNSFNASFKEYLKQNEVEKVIVGFPLTLNNKKSQQTEKIISWNNEKQNLFPHIPFLFFDERLTSKFAKNLEKQINYKTKTSNHARAAAIILENYLESIKSIKN